MPLFSKKTLCPLILGIALLLNGCVYSRVTSPLDKDFQQTELGDKIGRSTSHCVLWLVCWGDSGSQRAALDGDISVLRHADVERTLYLFGLYAKTTTVLYGD